MGKTINEPMFRACVFTFDETDGGCLVKVKYLRECFQPEVRRSDGYLCESAHTYYIHVDKDEASLFYDETDAFEAIRLDTGRGDVGAWTRIHNDCYWPKIKAVVADNNLWGWVEKV